MAAGVQIPGNGETIDLQQQVARLQALLEASRQVHSTTREEDVLEQVLRIVVRELEMGGASFAGTGLAYGDEPDDHAEGVLRYPLNDRDGKRMTELLVAAPDGRELTIYEADFIEGLALQAGVDVDLRLLCAAGGGRLLQQAHQRGVGGANGLVAAQGLVHHPVEVS